MIKKIFHIILAASVFISTAGIWSNNHYCKNELTKSGILAMFGKCCSAESATCSDAKMKCSSEDHEDNCCHNKTEFHKLNQDQALTASEFNQTEKFESFNLILHFSSGQVSTTIDNNYNHFKYLPPLIVFDYQVRLQTFRC